MAQTVQVDVAIIGAGTAGMYALREVRRAGLDFVLIDHGPLGTVCARVGCMPSKIALHAGAQWQAALQLDQIGGSGMERLRLDHRAAWATLRKQRDGFANPTANRSREIAGNRLLEGRARFLSSDRLAVELNDGGHREIEAKAVVIAAGSRPIVPGWLDNVRERVITTDDLFELETLPASIGILGLGAIGMEMGLALSRLGVKVTGADIAPFIGGMTDAEVSERAVERFGSEFEMWLQTETRLTHKDGGIVMEADGNRRADVEFVLAALGRRTNIDGLGLAEAGIEVNANGVPDFDARTMQVGELSVFLAGDVNGSRQLMHEAVDEGVIAGFNAAHVARNPEMKAQAFARKTPLAVAFTDPDLVVVGASLSELDPKQIVIGSAEGQGNGRARILHEPRSILRVYADRADGRLLGAAMLAPRGEHLAHLLALAIGRGETAASLLQMPFYHPVIEEMLQSALQEAIRQLAPARDLPLGLHAI